MMKKLGLMMVGILAAAILSPLQAAGSRDGVLQLLEQSEKMLKPSKQSAQDKRKLAQLNTQLSKALENVSENNDDHLVGLVASTCVRDNTPSAPLFSTCLDWLESRDTASAAWRFLEQKPDAETSVMWMHLAGRRSEELTSSQAQCVTTHLTSKLRAARDVAVRLLSRVPPEMREDTSAKLLSGCSSGLLGEAKVRQALRVLWKSELEGADPQTWAEWVLWINVRSALDSSLVSRAKDESRAVTTHGCSKYFEIAVNSGCFALVSDFSLSMGPAFTQSMDVTTRHASATDFKTVTLDLASKHELVLRRQLELLRQLPKGCRFNMATFGDSVRQFSAQSKALDETSMKAAYEFLGKQPLTFGTPIYEGLAAMLSDSDVDTVFLLTDGRPTNSKLTTDEEIESRCRRWAVLQQVTFHCIDVGQIFGGTFYKKSGDITHKTQQLTSHDYLQRVAMNSGGSYVCVKSLKDVECEVPASESVQN